MFEQLGLDPIKLGIQAFNFLLLLLHPAPPGLQAAAADAGRPRAPGSATTWTRPAGCARRASRTGRATAQQLNQARDEARSVLDEANATAQRIREQAMAEAEAQNAVSLRRAQEAIGREKEQAIGELRREVADLAIMAASHVVGRSLDGEDQRRLVDQAIAEVERP